MADYVWVSKAMTDAALIARVRTDVSARDTKISIAAERLNNKGQAVPPDMCPKRVWLVDDPSEDNPDPKPFAPISNLFAASAYWIVPSKVAEIIARFDLGGGSLYPVSDGLYEFGDTTRMPDEYFTWIFGNVKRGFLEEYSPAAKPMGGSDARDLCVFSFDTKDDDIAVSRAVLAGPDVWVDPTLFQSLFLSRLLGDALVAAGLRHDFRLLSCRVI